LKCKVKTLFEDFKIKRAETDFIAAIRNENESEVAYFA
jgi:hypothetical protein